MANHNKLTVRSTFAPVLAVCLVLIVSLPIWSLAQEPAQARTSAPQPERFKVYYRNEGRPRSAAATIPIDRAELHQALLDLNSPWTVMCVAAHPDDDDGTTLTMLRRKYGVHTVSLFS